MPDPGDGLDRLVEIDRQLRWTVLQTTIREVIHPFAGLYLMLIGDKPLHIGDFEIIIRKRPRDVDGPSHYDLSNPKHPAHTVAEAARRRALGDTNERCEVKRPFVGNRRQ